jgi:hypothetical protein
MQAILKSLPLGPWMTVETTPLSPGVPVDPAHRGWKVARGEITARLSRLLAFQSHARQVVQTSEGNL